MSTTTQHLKPRAAAPGTLTATRLKVTTTLNAGEVLAVPAPDRVPRVALRIQLPNRIVTAEIASKSLRKVQAAARELGADNVVLLLQGYQAVAESARSPRRLDCEFCRIGPIFTSQLQSPGTQPIGKAAGALILTGR